MTFLRLLDTGKPRGLWKVLLFDEIAKLTVLVVELKVCTCGAD
jgi:hypothetical protein